MTTSITDARFTSIHFTPGHLASLDFDPPPESGWGVMPGYDETLDVPDYLEPPRMDADETLPNMIHPSYPFGRPVTRSRIGVKGGMGMGMVGNLLHPDMRDGEERWDEWGAGQLVEREKGREVPPGMAGAKRPPSPPSPALRPSHIPVARSVHLANLYARQRHTSPVLPRDPFDAPVPNETYESDPNMTTETTMGDLDRWIQHPPVPPPLPAPAQTPAQVPVPTPAQHAALQRERRYREQAEMAASTADLPPDHPYYMQTPEQIEQHVRPWEQEQEEYRMRGGQVTLDNTRPMSLPPSHPLYGQTAEEVNEHVRRWQQWQRAAPSQTQ